MSDHAPVAPLLPPPVAPTARPAGGLAIAALVVGIAAFLTGLVAGLGLVIAIAGLILGILAVRAKAPRGFSITGLALSGVAAITNLGAIAFIVVAALAATSATAPQNMTTPCYSFDGPAGYINNIGDPAIEDCTTELELWGELNADGTIKNTGVGGIWGSVNVEPVRLSSSDEWAPDGDLDAAIEELSKEYIPALGEVISLREWVELDGVEANLTRVRSAAETTETKALIVGFAPESYPTSRGDVRFFVISVVIPDDSGEEVLDTILDSWRWE